MRPTSRHNTTLQFYKGDVNYMLRTCYIDTQLQKLCKVSSTLFETYSRLNVLSFHTALDGFIKVIGKILQFLVVPKNVQVAIELQKLF